MVEEIVAQLERDRATLYSSLPWIQPISEPLFHAPRFGFAPGALVLDRGDPSFLTELLSYPLLQSPGACAAYVTAFGAPVQDVRPGLVRDVGQYSLSRSALLRESPHVGMKYREP